MLLELQQEKLKNRKYAFSFVLAKLKISGIVQGIGFRPFVYRIASKLNLKGYILNLGDAGVEIEVEGKKEEIDRFIKFLKDKKPPLAEIHEIKIEWLKERKKYRTFEIRKSREERNNGISIIPPDISICNECINDMEKKGRRHNYFFTTCTNCGPRFTIIKKLPYDRENTTMEKFEMCSECHKEFTNPLDRRYHAQTIACKNCGPKIFLKRNKKIEEGIDAIWDACNLLMNGEILAIKGIGGYHLACVVDEAKKLRIKLNRKEKPFALMVKNIEMAKEIAVVNEYEEKVLKSYIKPIVLLEKKVELPNVAPGLHNYGIMLPYTGLHHLIFKKINEPLIMTSANLPGKPIINNEKEIEKIADYILFYNRDIWQRCDDSIIKFIGNKPVLIRRSRGFVPLGIKLNRLNKKNILALGAEENVTICLLKKGNAFLSQHIGKVSHYETFEFLKNALKHMENLLNFKADIVACDMHPNFVTTKYAEEISQNVIKIQHHHAHIASVMAEHEIKEAIGIAIDGVGYGKDGNIWGGEILYSNLKDYERLAHLQNHVMIGGDLATKYPLRMLIGILGNEIYDFVYERRNFFPHKEIEIEIIFKQLKKEKRRCSSCGRLLDAISALLDICHIMDYEGEPAMKLESKAKKGKDVLKLEPIIKNNVINTKYLVEQIWENSSKLKKEDLAYSAEEYIAKSLAEIAMEKADEKGINNIVISGGCAYNEHISTRIKEIVEKNGYKFYINEVVPCGDGGISFGQAIIATFTIHNSTLL